ncbi:MAG: hypothetical protein LBJ23_10315 [Tannerella sp.]|jgi:hypothetical protein|nr:hypothetical protein [Tannerella sp.]
MKEKVYRRKDVNRIVLAGTVLFGIVEETALYFFLPQYYTPYTIFIPCYFVLLALSLLWALSHFRVERIHIGRALARMMLLSASQFITSIAALVCYIVFVGVQKNTFVLVFGIYYIWFLALKMFVFYNMEHYHKITQIKNREKEKENEEQTGKE